MKGVQPYKGKLLLATPSLVSDFFNRTVVLVTAHDKEGSVGFVLNKKLPYKLSTFVPQIEDKSIPVFQGGPVEMEHLNYIHSRPDLIPNSQHITGNVYWGGNFEFIIDMINDGSLKSHEIRFFLGYSGWGKEQLQDELNQESWFIVNSSFKNPDLLAAYSDSLWKDEMKGLGGSKALWSNMPEDPDWN